MSIDDVSEKLGSLQSSMDSLEAWMSDHQDQDREAFLASDTSIRDMNRKIDKIHVCVMAEKVRQKERNRLAGKVSGAVALLVSVVVGAIELFLRH